MGHKTDLLEVREIADKVKQEKDHMLDLLTTLESDKKAIINMERFLGSSAHKVKSYLDDLHIPLNEFFVSLFENISSNFDKHISKFQSNVDSGESAIVQNGYLEVDIETMMKSYYQNFKGSMTALDKQVSNIYDILPLELPESYDITKSYFALSDIVKDLQKNHSSFEGSGKMNTNKVEEILTGIDTIITKATQVDPTARFTDYERGSANKFLFGSKEVVSVINNLKEVVDASKTTKAHYTQYDGKGNPKKPNVKPHPSTYSGKEQAKYVGREVARGQRDTVRQFTRLPSSAGKLLGPLGIGLDGYNNYHDAKAEGLGTTEAVVRSVGDTVVDTAVSTSVMSASIAIGTMVAPGIGTAVGAIAGLAI